MHILILLCDIKLHTLKCVFLLTAYGKDGVKMNFVDRIFVGELTNTIMCEECEHVGNTRTHTQKYL